MTSHLPQTQNLAIRPLQSRDLEAVDALVDRAIEVENPSSSLESGALDIHRHLSLIRRWYWPLKCLSWFPNPLQYLLCVHVANDSQENIRGLIQISPFNRTRSTWRVDRLFVDPGAGMLGTGSQLIRHCLEAIWEARMWLLEVEVNEKEELALYRHNGFQPLAQMTYWAIAPDLLEALAQREPDLPNLMPVSNADAQLLCQLDTAAMPPLVRQVFDRHIHDFQTSLPGAVFQGVRQWLNNIEEVSGYVFEPQRKAAIGYFKMRLCRDGSQPHVAELTVHPAYTWLYPELLSQMARIAQDFPAQSLQLASADYQPEREEYLEQIGADPVYHTLLMSRSVWHKLREAKPAALELQLSEVIQGLQGARKPIPSRISWLQKSQRPGQSNGKPDSVQKSIEEFGQLPNADRFDFSQDDDTLS
jgi:GNAT superfamily N-acetyltransferase